LIGLLISWIPDSSTLSMFCGLFSRLSCFITTSSTLKKCERLFSSFLVLWPTTILPLV
jgi:hypothetical protein